MDKSKRILIPLLTGMVFAMFFTISPAWAMIEIGEHIPISIDTPQNYKGAPEAEQEVVWTYELSHPGATYIAIHFTDFDLGPGDLLLISDPEGGQGYTLEKNGKMGAGTFWAQHIKGDTAVLKLIAAGEKGGAGFNIDEYVAGYVELEPVPGPEAICGTDDKGNAICYQASHPTEYARGRAVARLLINGSSLCTGWLVTGNDHLITNEHCIGTAADALNTDYEFMSEAPTCGSANCQMCFPGAVFTGATFIQGSFNLDYALVQINAGSPAATYGYLQIDDRAAIIGEQIYIPQHPGGRAKEFAIFSTHQSDFGGVPLVHSVTELGCDGRPGPDVGYYADTEGGSSGSPVLAHSSHKVIALHHCANCLNRGVPIHLICDEMPPGICDGPPPPPPNDECSNAICVEDGVAVNGTTTDATGTDITSCTSGDAADVWYSYTPSTSETVVVSLCGSSYDTALAIFDDCGGQELACIDDSVCGGLGSLQSEISIALNAGTTYLIRVSGFNGATGDFILAVTGGGGFCGIVNDECSGAICVEDRGPVNGTTVGATGTDITSCTFEDTIDVWYSYTPSISETVVVSLCGSSYDTALAIFDDCGGTEMACIDDSVCGGLGSLQSEISIALNAGTTYLIRVSGFAGSTGDFILTVTGGGGTCGCTPPPAPTDPYPGDNYTDVPLDMLLQWNTGNQFGTAPVYSDDNLDGDSAKNGATELIQAAIESMNARANGVSADNAPTESGSASPLSSASAAASILAGMNEIASLDVALVAADSYGLDVQAKLVADGRFASVTIIDTTLVTPTVAELQAFDAVMVWTNSTPADNVALGNNLADYIDGGGGVVLAMFAISVSSAARTIEGRFLSDNYYCIERSLGSTVAGNAVLGTVYTPGHPIMAGVVSFDGGTGSFRPPTGPVPGASRVADWSTGEVLVADRTDLAAPRADIGFWPGSSDALANGWVVSTDGDLIMANALEYVTGVDPDASCYPFGGTSETFTGTDRLRGNVYTVSDSQTLSEIKMELNFTGGGGVAYILTDEFD